MHRLISFSITLFLINIMAAHVLADPTPGACCFLIAGTPACMITDDQASCEEGMMGTFHAGATCDDLDQNNVADICEQVQGYEYLPGDANMINGQWPPLVIGADVTYMVGYFRGINGPCLIGGFFNSADANGDCLVIGSDVTKMVTYFRGLTTLSHCPDYPPAWPTPADLPAEEPAGWPNCETAR